MSDMPTPRTEQAVDDANWTHGTWVKADFARTLERELAEATRSPYIDSDERPVEVIEAIYEAIDGITADSENGNNSGSIVSRVKAAVSMAGQLAQLAAERDSNPDWVAASEARKKAAHFESRCGELQSQLAEANARLEHGLQENRDLWSANQDLRDRLDALDSALRSIHATGRGTPLMRLDAMPCSFSSFAGGRYE